MNRAVLIYLSTLGILAATWWAMRRGIETPAWPLEKPLETIPAVWEGREGITGKLDASELDILQPTSYLRRDYPGRGTDPEFQILIAYFAVQEAGRSMHSPKNCLPSTGWDAVESRIFTIPDPDGGEAFPVNLYRIRQGEHSMMMLYWYQSPDRTVASELKAKGYLLLDRAVNHRSPGSIVRVTLPDRPEYLNEGIRIAKWLRREMALCIGRSDRQKTAFGLKRGGADYRGASVSSPSNSGWRSNSRSRFITAGTGAASPRS